MNKIESTDFGNTPYVDKTQDLSVRVSRRIRFPLTQKYLNLIFKALNKIGQLNFAQSKETVNDIWMLLDTTPQALYFNERPDNWMTALA